MDAFSQSLRKRWLWLAVNIGAALPLLWMAWDFQQGNLIDPIDAFTGRTGQSAIILLLLTLAVTPIVTLTSYRKLIGVRKSLGLWAFAYASMHLIVFVGLDYGFSLEYIVKDGLAQKPYIIVGSAALLILLPLAVTSTRGWMRRMGRNWKRLHKWIYAAGILAALHYIWVAKLDLGRPLIYSVILGVLLAARIPPVRSALARVGRKVRSHGGSMRPETATPKLKRSPVALDG
jgi:methionine sulfoxide reductase heme-binding subunit